MTSDIATPHFKLVGLAIERLLVVRDVSWPRDGMGWDSKIPNVVVMGGINGSGKTTVLEALFAVFRLFRDSFLPDFPVGSRLTADFEVLASDVKGSFRVIAGDAAFCRGREREGDIVLLEEHGRWNSPTGGSPLFLELMARSHPKHFVASDLPGVVYFPTSRILSTPQTTLKAPGKLRAPDQFAFRCGPGDGFSRDWNDSLEAVLYAARWEDLNAKEEGREAGFFAALADSIHAFFEGKKLVWENGELRVHVSSIRSSHYLDGLSSGEKQIVLIVAELLRRWRPGSLIMIDEPELHMHPTWLAKLWRLLTRRQKERGGQVIVATQSTQLFGLADAGTTTLLGSKDFG